MKQLKIFLASSINEFAGERLVLKNFVRQMENILIDHDTRLRMFICEYADNAVSDGRKQNEFLAEIDDSDIFLILTGVRLGGYTLEEYQYALALQEKRNDGLPRIVAAIKSCDSPEQTATDFSVALSPSAQRADFTELAELKTALASAIGALLDDSISFRIESNKVFIAEKAVKL